MDATTKTFIFILLASLILGILVLLIDPSYRIENIYQTNKNYYPQINEQSIKKDFKKLFEKQF